MSNLKAVVNAYNNKAGKKASEPVISCYYVALKFETEEGCVCGHHTTANGLYKDSPFSQAEIFEEAKKIILSFVGDKLFLEYYLSGVIEVCYPDRSQDSWGQSASLNDSDLASLKEAWNLMTA